MQQMHLSQQIPVLSVPRATPGTSPRMQRSFRRSPVLCVLSALSASLLVLGVLAPRTALAQTPVPTRTTLSASGNVASQSGNQPGTLLTATIATSTGAPVTTGTVDFVLAGGQSLGSGIVAPSGTATLLVSSLPAADSTSLTGSGQLGITAEYHANNATTATTATAATTAPVYDDSQSVAVAVATPAATTGTASYTVSGNPTTVTVKQGAYGTSILTVTSVNGFAGPIQFSCSTLPAQVTCSFTPTQQTLTAGASFSSTLQLQTQGASGTASARLSAPSQPGRHTGLALAFVLPGTLALFGFARRRNATRSMLGRSLQLLAVGLLLTGTSIGLSSCNQRYQYLNHGPSVATGTPTGTYTINVAVDGDQGSAVSEQIIPISLVVQ
jgi:hypothetical protein